jgi:NADP-dependent 3-hydroxy acid dehydrogenase YdfG
MAKTILVCGFGPGISQAVARKFGKEGFSVALVGRSRERLDAGAKALTDAGVTAKGFACDLSDAAAVKKTVADVRASLGPVTVIHYNAYGSGAGDLLTSEVDDFKRVLDVAVSGLVVAVQAAHPDMRDQKGAAAVLVTGGGFAFYDEKVDAMAVGWNAMGIAVSKAAQHKLTGLLREKLKADGIYVGEVVVLGMVKGTAFDTGHGTLDPNDIAAKFWELYGAREVASVNFG